MSATTETRPTTEEVTVYRCDVCEEPVGEQGLRNGVSVVTTLIARDAIPVTPPYNNGWHWELCWRCFGEVVEKLGGAKP